MLRAFLNRVARRRGLVGDDPDDIALALGQHLEINGKEVADHSIGGYVLESFFEICQLHSTVCRPV